ncbi:unnamed protein product [Camellia sinensis]
MCKDLMRDRDWYYKEVLEKSGWRGVGRLWRLKGRTMYSICLTPLVTMLWLCSNKWLLS